VWSIILASLLAVTAPSDTGRFEPCPNGVLVPCCRPSERPCMRLLGIDRGQLLDSSRLDTPVISVPGGSITIQVRLPRSMSATADSAVYLNQVGGALPNGLVIPSGATRLIPGASPVPGYGFIVLRWPESERAPRPFDFRLTAVVVDKTGKRSAPSDTLRVAHDGSKVVWDPPN
jgi:hypothetical protein